mgnify:CR=1 FL=1
MTSATRTGKVGTLLLRAAFLAVFAGVVVAATLYGGSALDQTRGRVEHLLLDRSFDRLIAGNGDGKPWPWAGFTVKARVTSLRLNESQVVISGVTGKTLAVGPAWLASSAEPGDEGTAIIAAPRDPNFTWIRNILPGDLIKVERADGKVFNFRAIRSRVVRWDNNEIDTAGPGQHLALVSRWPFGGPPDGPMRYIVDADIATEHDSVVANLSRPRS